MPIIQTRRRCERNHGQLVDVLFGDRLFRQSAYALADLFGERNRKPVQSITPRPIEGRTKWHDDLVQQHDTAGEYCDGRHVGECIYANVLVLSNRSAQRYRFISLDSEKEMRWYRPRDERRHQQLATTQAKSTWHERELDHASLASISIELLDHICGIVSNKQNRVGHGCTDGISNATRAMRLQLQSVYGLHGTVVRNDLTFIWKNCSKCSIPDGNQVADISPIRRRGERDTPQRRLPR